MLIRCCLLGFVVLWIVDASVQKVTAFRKCQMTQTYISVRVSSV